MTQITAADVNNLRKITGAGMMDCKKALQETGGNTEMAIDLLRKKGQKVASNRADREASEGVVISKTNSDKKSGVLISLNCETDFVAKNEDFISFTNKIADIAINNEAKNLQDLLKTDMDGHTIEQNITNKIGVIGEKIELAYYEKIDAAYVISYIHPGNKLATLVGFDQEEIEEQQAKDVAMQVAAMNPISIDKDDIPKSVIEKEIEIGKEQAREEGKPEEILEKIAVGKLNKFFKENTLMNQQFIKESKQTVKQYLEEHNKNIKVVGFKRYTLNI
ncbi:translation elongation factor Ts [Bacteroidota bacterium]